MPGEGNRFRSDPPVAYWFNLFDTAQNQVLAANHHRIVDSILKLIWENTSSHLVDVCGESQPYFLFLLGRTRILLEPLLFDYSFTDAYGNANGSN